MNTIPFDTLKLARRLHEAGFTTAQADGAAEALAMTFSDELATKADLRDLKGEMKADSTGLRGEVGGLRGEIAMLRGDIAKLGGDLRAEISILRADTAKWIIGAVFVNFAGLLGVVALVWQLARR